MGDSEPGGTQVTPLCSIRAAFPVSGLSVGGALAPLVSGSEQPQPEPIG